MPNLYEIICSKNGQLLYQQLHYAWNYRFYRDGSLYACASKKIKKLVTLTRNGITASVRCASSTPVVLNTHTKTGRISKTVTFFSKWNTNIKLLLQFQLTSLLYVTMIYAGQQENTAICQQKSTRQKAPKCSKVGVTNIQEKQVDLFMTPHEHRLQLSK